MGWIRWIPHRFVANRMVGAEVPSRPVLLYSQSMAISQMPSEHLAAPPAFEAHDITAIDRAPNWDGRSSLLVGFC